MKFRKVLAALLVSIGLFQFAPSSFGFALLGPFAPWMEETNGLRQPGDIGGPMDIGSGYRWNVPVVTYGFDQSFLDYFGTDGVAAVESAIQILNDLPPASQIVLTNYPFNSQPVNYTAQAQNLSDLKSSTLFLLLEQMGLTQPTRYIYVLRRWTPAFIPSSPQWYSFAFDWYPWAFPDFMVQRNFDPQTLDASTYINGTIYSAYMGSLGNQNYIVPYPADPYANTFTAVADLGVYAGGYYTGLTTMTLAGCVICSPRTM